MAKRAGRRTRDLRAGVVPLGTPRRPKTGKRASTKGTSLGHSNAPAAKSSRSRRKAGG